MVATTLLACQKDEVQTPIQSNDEQANSSIEFRSSSAGLDKELIDQWINWSNIQYDYNYLGKGILEKEYGKLALGFVYRYENANGQYTAIPFVSPDNTVKAVALTQLKNGVTSYHLYRGNTDISNSFNFSSQGGSGGTVAGLFGDLDYECEGDTGGGLFGGGGGCGGSDFYENADGGLRTLCLYEDCPNGHIYLKCRHPRILCDSDGIIIGNDGDNPPETGGGTPVVITFPTNPNGTSIPFFPSGGGSGGSYSLIFTRADLKDAISDFNDEHGVNLTYGQLLHSDPACLIFASISTSLNSTVGAGELERCMEEEYIKTLFKDCTGDMSSEASEYLQELIFDSEISDPCDASKSHHDIIDELRDDVCANNLSMIGLEDVVDIIENTDIIRILPALKTDCPRYDCIINNMMSGTMNTSFMCGLFTPFEGGSKVNLSFISSLDFVNQPDAWASTSIVPSGSSEEIIMKINKNHCNDVNITKIEIFETVQHELIHADINRRLIENYGYSSLALSLLGYQASLDLLLMSEYGMSPGQDEHALMINHYLIDAVNSLIELNGGVGSYSDFVGLVLYDFPEPILLGAGYTVSGVLNMYNHSISYLSTSSASNINSNLFGC